MLFLCVFDQVALKRQQAAEDAIALGLRAMATGQQFGFLPPGPVFAGVPENSEEQHANSTPSPLKTSPEPPPETEGMHFFIFSLAFACY